MKAVELMELPQAPVSDDTLILVATPDGPGRATLKEVRGLGLSGQETFFLATASASGITTDSEGWKEVPQATTADKRYLWSYTRFTYMDGKAVTTPPAIVGVYGNTGPKGDKGDTGEPFTIARTYPSVADMNAGHGSDGVRVGSFVAIDTSDINDEDNAKLFLKGETAYTYITDMSGIQGIQGPKGDGGESAVISGVTATIDSGVGTPSVDVTMGGTELDRTFSFAFRNLKGGKGDTGPSVLKWFSMNSLGFTGGQDSVVQLEDFLAALQSKHGDGGIANIIWQNASSAKVTDGTTTISINGGHLVWGVNESVSNIDMEYGHGNLLSSHRWIGMEDERCRLRYSRNGDLQEDNCPPCPHRRPRVHPVQGAVCADHPVPRHKLE